MKISSGKMKGLNIPFNGKKFCNAESTPQKVKEALFSIIGETIEDESFLDLYSCSGQIGFEAVSRGAPLVVFNDNDYKRFDFIRSIAKEWGLADSTIILNLHASACLRYLRSKEIKLNYIFIDPPYSKIKGKVQLYEDILNLILKNNIMKPDSTVIIQHYSENWFPESIGDIVLINTRRYGTNSLSFFKKTI